MRKTNDDEILRLLKEGKTQKEIAEIQGVSPVAIHKRLKRLLPKPKSLDKLTDKEQKFVLEVAKGKTRTQSALASYECSSLESAKSIGNQLMAKSDIQVAVSEIMQQEGLPRRYRVRKLKEHIDNRDPNISLKGLDQSWKLDGAYTDTHVNIDIDINALQDQIGERDKRMVALREKLKQGFIRDLREEYPDMSDEKIERMAKETLEKLHPENERIAELKERAGYIPIDVEIVDIEPVNNEQGEMAS